MLVAVSQLTPVSVPLPPLQMSVPLPPLSLSAPLAPKSSSSPVPPQMISLPSSPSIVSRPASPWMTSGPGVPERRLSFPTVPSILASRPPHRTGGPFSKAPMSQAAPCGRVTPRWSVGRQPAIRGALTDAGLPAGRAWVRDGTDGWLFHKSLLVRPKPTEIPRATATSTPFLGGCQVSESTAAIRGSTGALRPSRRASSTARTFPPGAVRSLRTACDRP